MQPHPDFADVELPRQFTLGAYHLTPLSPDFVDEDFEAVIASADVVTGIFGTWPEGLTRDSNLIDLAWHEREFIARRSFSWILRDGAGVYIGCFYLNPDIGARGCAEAAMWLCDIPDRMEVADTLKADLTTWMTQTVPSGIDVRWLTRPVLA